MAQDASGRIWLGTAGIGVVVLVPTPGKALATPVTIAAWRTRPSFYLLTTEDRIIPPALQRHMALRAGAEVSEAVAGHAVYLSRPEAVAEVQARAARTLSRSPRSKH
jgi:pimeloyl-ACP methyl ester carboxylesterase